MTRKDYYLIAETLAKGKSSPDHAYFVDLIAHALGQENPAFKPELFNKVAGLEDANETKK